MSEHAVVMEFTWVALVIIFLWNLTIELVWDGTWVYILHNDDDNIIYTQLSRN